MRVVDSEELQWHAGPGHREGGIYMRDLLLGEPGADNYWLVLNRVEGAYDAPPHKHAFEQVRFMLEGSFNFGPQDQEAGSIGYFCEGTTYTQTARGPSLMLLLQCEGASRTRYTHVQELYGAVRELREAGGVFKDGLYTAPDGAVRDGYEAAWEHIAGQAIHYPEARFLGPVIMAPDAFSFHEREDAAGVFEKRLGSFNERGLELSFWRLNPGAQLAWRGPEQGKALFFVTQGDGCVSSEPGSEPVRLGKHFAVEVNADETGAFQGGDKEALELFVMRMPK